MATHDWQALGAVWYRRQELFEMQWVDQPRRLDYCVVAAAPFGGPIAAVRNEKIFQPIRGSLSNELQVFTSAGTKLSSTPWKFAGLLALGWSPDLALICVFQSGMVHSFSPFCEPLHVFSFDEKIKLQGGLLQAIVIDEGIAAVTTKHEVYFNISFEANRYYRLADAGLTSPPVAMCAFPLNTENDDKRDKATISIAVLVSTENGKLYCIDKSKRTELEIGDNRVLCFSVSRSRKHVASLTNNGALYIFATLDLSKILEIATFEFFKPPRQMEWCGDDCVAIYLAVPTPSDESQHMLFLGGPKSEWLPYQFSSAIHLIPEIDGLRIVSVYSSEFMQRVPRTTEAIFGIGSCEPSAMLCYAMERYEYGDISADESLRAIKGKLNEAVNYCVLASTHEWDVEQSKALLRAAAFGRHFIDASGSFDLLIEACRDIRICLAIRCSPIWMPLTVPQLRLLTIQQLVYRIAQYRQHLLAYRICEYVGLNSNFVLVHWASQKFIHSLQLTDDQLCTIIHQKFQKNIGISYADVAYMAAQAGRNNLACSLLEYEPYCRNQVRMLLKLAEIDVALDKAILSKDCNLVYECMSAICALKSSGTDLNESLHDFLFYLKGRDASGDLFVKFCFDTNQLSLLQQFYERLGKMYNAGVIAIYIAYQKDDWSQHKSWLSFAAGFMGPTKGKSGTLHEFDKSTILKQIELLSVQLDLETKANSNYWVGGPHHFRGLSLMQTIRSIIIKGHSSEAERLQKMFKVSDKQYWYCKINALADSAQFSDLLTFANASRVSPVGYEPFLKIFLANNRPALAAKLIPKLKEPELESKWYRAFGMAEEAEMAQKRVGGSGGQKILQSLSDALSWRKA